MKIQISDYDESQKATVLRITHYFVEISKALMVNWPNIWPKLRALGEECEKINESHKETHSVIEQKTKKVVVTGKSVPAPASGNSVPTVPVKRKIPSAPRRPGLGQVMKDQQSSSE